MNLEPYLNHPDIFQHRLIDPATIPFSPAVTEACRANRCGKYATCWTCPPGVGAPEELERKIKSYSHALVFSCKHDLEDCFDFEGMMEGQKRARRALQDITDAMRANGERFWALGCEGCTLCPSCTYPDAPCRFPDKMISSMEAYGMLVLEVCKANNLTYYYGSTHIAYTACILLA